MQAVSTEFYVVAFSWLLCHRLSLRSRTQLRSSAAVSRALRHMQEAGLVSVADRGPQVGFDRSNLRSTVTLEQSPARGPIPSYVRRLGLRSCRCLEEPTWECCCAWLATVPGDCHIHGMFHVPGVRTQAASCGGVEEGEAGASDVR
jgi:hypothetical protein